MLVLFFWGWKTGPRFLSQLLGVVVEIGNHLETAPTRASHDDGNERGKPHLKANTCAIVTISLIPNCVLILHIGEVKDKENNTWARKDMEFLFKYSTRYLSSERSAQVRYRVKLEQTNSISPSNHELLCSFHRAVFKWLSQNQNQSNYFDQSQREQTAPWTNHNS